MVSNDEEKLQIVNEIDLGKDACFSLSFGSVNSAFMLFIGCENSYLRAVNFFELLSEENV